MQTATPIMSRAEQAYKGSEEQGCLLLQAVESCRSMPLTTRCICKVYNLLFLAQLHDPRQRNLLIGYLAHKVARSWESNSSPETIKAVYCLMIHLLKSTALYPNGGHFENGLRYYCHHASSSIPTICPSLTLLMAAHYIDKLKNVSWTDCMVDRYEKKEEEKTKFDGRRHVGILRRPQAVRRV